MTRVSRCAKVVTYCHITFALRDFHIFGGQKCEPYPDGTISPFVVGMLKDGVWRAVSSWDYREDALESIQDSPPEIRDYLRVMTLRTAFSRNMLFQALVGMCGSPKGRVEDGTYLPIRRKPWKDIENCP